MIVKLTDGARREFVTLIELGMHLNEGNRTWIYPILTGQSTPGDWKTVRCGIEGLLTSLWTDHLTLQTTTWCTILLTIPYVQEQSCRNSSIIVIVFKSDDIAAQLKGNHSWHPFSTERSAYMQSIFYIRLFLRSQKHRWPQWGVLLRNSPTLEGLPSGDLESHCFLLSMFPSKVAQYSLVPTIFPYLFPN